jgi:glycosyltransferase involved in cell wall biosynthesis
LRVLYLAASAEIGGGNRYLLTLWSALSRYRDVELLAICPKDGPMVRLSRAQGIPCEVIDFGQMEWRRPVASWSQYNLWQGLLSRFRPHVIHANHALGARSILLPAWRAAVPVICHIHFPPPPNFTSWAFRYLPKPKWFIINSHAVESEVGESLRRACPNAPHTVIHNPVDSEIFRSYDRVSNRRPRVGIVANLLPVKGHLDFLEMTRELIRRRVDAEFWVIGEDIHKKGYREVLVDKADELGVSNAIQFLGYCDNIPQIMNQLDIIVSCSHVEPFGISLIEAMATERPVVATRVDGIPEVVEDGVTGFLVSPRAPLELADAVQCLISDAHLRVRMGQAGRQRVQQLFSCLSHVDRMMSLYDKVLKLSTTDAELDKDLAKSLDQPEI